MAICKECVHVEVCREYVTGLAAARGVDLDVTELEQVLDSDDCDHFRDRSRFVELPCPIKPRDKVWYILEGLSEVDLKEYAIKSGECAVGNEPDIVIEVGTLGFWVNQLSTRNENYLVPDDCDFISWDEIGKSYFLSKEEAEQALKEREP